MPALVFINRVPYEVEDWAYAGDLRSLAGLPSNWPVVIKGMPGEEDRYMREEMPYFMQEMTEFLCHEVSCL